MALPRWLTRTVGQVARTQGRIYDYATPGKGTSSLTKLGRNISDVTKDTHGSVLRNAQAVPLNTLGPVAQKYNIYKPSTSSNGGGKNSRNSANGGYSTNADGTVNEYGYGGGSGGGGGGGGGGAAQYDPNDPNSKESNSKRSLIQNTWNTLKGVYDAIYGDIDNVVKDKAADLSKSYDDQTNQVQNDYTKTAEQQANVYGGRGLGSSSYYQNAQKDASDTLSNTINQLVQDQQSKTSQLGQYADTQKAGVAASRQGLEPYMNQLGGYGLQDLNQIEGNLNSSLAGAQQQRAGLKTNSQFAQDLNGITPIQQQGSQQLASKLQTLINSAAPSSAKRYIAEGLIKAGTMGDANQSAYWKNYFEQLIGGGQ